MDVERVGLLLTFLKPLAAPYAWYQFLAAFNRREWCFNAARKNASGRHLTAEQKR